MLTARTPDETYNDLSEPRMGMARARFGRNIPAPATSPSRTFVNEHSAWWDGSVIYGDSLGQQKLVRSGTSPT